MLTTPAHRKNDDGTWDSICLACFLTIGRAENEAALEEQELEHSCYPLQFSRAADHPRPDYDSA